MADDNPYGIEVAPLTPPDFEEEIEVDSSSWNISSDPRHQSSLAEHEDNLQQDVDSVNMMDTLPSSGSVSPNAAASGSALQQKRMMDFLQQQNLLHTEEEHAGQGQGQEEHEEEEKVESTSSSDKTELEAALREMEQHMQLALHSNASPDKVKVDKEQLTLLYAALLAKQRGLNVCSCKRHRCKSCLNCKDSHCICQANQATESSGGSSSLAQVAPAPTPATAVPATAATAAAAAAQKASQRKVPDISDVARYYVRPPKMPRGTPFQCQICHKAASSNRVKCGACHYTVHITCINADASLIPRDIWFCKECFPEADHIYYAQSNPTKLSIVEIGRVIQIVTDQAHRLDKEVQIAFVEHFLKSIPATGATRIFIHNKQRLQQRK